MQALMKSPETIRMPLDRAVQPKVWVRLHPDHPAQESVVELQQGRLEQVVPANPVPAAPDNRVRVVAEVAARAENRKP